MSERKQNVKSYEEKLKNRSEDYKQYGRYLVKELTTADTTTRFISFLGDIVAMLSPILLLDCIMLFLVGGLIPYSIYDAARVAVNVLVYISIFLTNTVLIYLFRGQTFGKIAMNLKIVGNKSNKELRGRVLVIRQLLGISLPFAILYFLFDFIGILLFMAINGIVTIVDKKHRSIIDIVLNTKVVILDDKGKKSKAVVVKEKAKEKILQADNKYDLHVYSSFSHDGEIEVEDLLKRAEIAGIKMLSITDHNCVKANNIAAKLAPMYNIEYVPGINIDCQYKGLPVRLLGYYINSNDDRFIRIEHENLAKEKAVTQRKIDLLEQNTGLKVNTEKLFRYNRFQVIGEEAIARDILTNTEYSKEKILAPYLSGNKSDKPITNFRKDFFGKGKPAYVPIIHPQLEDMIALIHSCDGVAVLAHPMRSLKEYNEVLLEILETTGLDGIEVFTPYHSINDMKAMINYAKKYKLGVTAGSEYHGLKRPTFILGKTKCPKDAEEIVANFINQYKK